MAGHGYKIATGFVEIKLGDESVFLRASAQLVKQVAGQIEQTLTQRVSAALNTVGEKFTEFGAKASLVFAPLTLALGGMVREGIETAKSIDQARNMFEQFGLTAATASGLIQDVYNRSNAWGQSFTSMLQQTMRLMGIFNGNIATVDKVQEAIGNLVGKLHIAGETADRVTTAIVQMYTKPSIQAEELLQLSEAGIDGWTLMADATGKSVAQLRQLSQQGKLLSSDVMPKLMAYLTTNPQWAGFAVANSKTLNGQLAIMKNQLQLLFAGPIIQNNAALVKAFQGLNEAIKRVADSGVIERFMTPLVNGFTALLNWFSRLTPSTQKWVVTLGLIAAVIGPVLLVFGKLFGSLGNLVGSLGRGGNALLKWVSINRDGASSSVALARGIDTAFRAVNSAGQAVLAPITAVRLGLINLKSGFDTARTGAYVLASDAFQAVRVASRVASEGVSSFARQVELVGLRSAVQFRAGLARAGDTITNFGTAIKLAAISGLDRLKSAAQSAQLTLARGLSSACDLAASGMKRLGSAAENMGGRLLQIGKVGLLGLIGFLGTALLSNEQFRNSIEQLANAIGGALAGPLSSMVNTLTSALQPVLPVITSLLEKVGGVFAQVANQAGPILVPILAQLGSILAQGIGLILPKIVQLAISLFHSLEPIVPVALRFGESILSALLPALTKLGGILGGSGLGNILPTIANLFGSIVGALSPLVELVVKFASNLLQTLLPPAILIVGVLGQLLLAVAPILGPVGQIIGLVANLAAMFLGALLPAVTPILKILLDLISSVLQPLMPLITTLAGILAGALAFGFRLLEPVIRLVVVALQGIVTVVQKVIDGIGWLVGKISEGASAIGGFLSKINPFASFRGLSAEVTPMLNSAQFGPKLQARMDVSPGTFRAIPFSGSVGSASFTDTATDLHQALTDFGTQLGAAGRVAPPDRQRSDATPARPAPQITVNAKTDADPYEIGREVAWQLKVSGR
ncbi:tape measure protein [Kutzneria chonburiensis]|uniref:Tape measure protein n=1 Tax=Kutzneria chonburiensis TaxID=1483604 RepID=A0ABV6N395_9PSEU|nr:tape measure protein [Kutzneria chonburiensis]